MKQLIAVSSFAAHHNVGLKPFIQNIHRGLVPVPSILLSAKANEPNVWKNSINLRPLLESSFEIALKTNNTIDLFIGYLANAEQAATLLDLITLYRPHLNEIFIDPIAGDNGNLYVNEEVAQAWKDLIPLANLIFPNYTECKLINNIALQEDIQADELLKITTTNYPNTNIILSGMREGNAISTYLKTDLKTTSISKPYIPKHINGAGDLLAAYFLKLFYEIKPIEKAFIQSVNRMHEEIINLYQ